MKRAVKAHLAAPKGFFRPHALGDVGRDSQDRLDPAGAVFFWNEPDLVMLGPLPTGIAELEGLFLTLVQCPQTGATPRRPMLFGERHPVAADVFGRFATGVAFNRAVDIAIAEV